MTIKEALKATINFPLPDNVLDKALIDAGLEGTADYSADINRDVDICGSGLLFILLTSGNISEGDYSISLPERSNLMALYGQICRKWGVQDLLNVKPTVKGRSNLW